MWSLGEVWPDEMLSYLTLWYVGSCSARQDYARLCKAWRGLVRLSEEARREKGRKKFHPLCYLDRPRQRTKRTQTHKLKAVNVHSHGRKKKTVRGRVRERKGEAGHKGKQKTMNYVNDLLFCIISSYFFMHLLFFFLRLLRIKGVAF